MRTCLVQQHRKHQGRGRVVLYNPYSCPWQSQNDERVIFQMRLTTDTPYLRKLYTDKSDNPLQPKDLENQASHFSNGRIRTIRIPQHFFMFELNPPTLDASNRGVQPPLTPPIFIPKWIACSYCNLSSSKNAHLPRFHSRPDLV